MVAIYNYFGAFCNLLFAIVVVAHANRGRPATASAQPGQLFGATGGRAAARRQRTDPMESVRPEMFVVGGPNGAGKTTVAEQLLPRSLPSSQFVNADIIAAKLSPHAPDDVAFQAGRMMLIRINELLEDGRTFALEATLASKTLVRFFCAAKARGYHVQLLFAFLDTPSLAVQRVAFRVQHGDHGISEP